MAPLVCNKGFLHCLLFCISEVLPLSHSQLLQTDYFPISIMTPAGSRRVDKVQKRCSAEARHRWCACTLKEHISVGPDLSAKGWWRQVPPQCCFLARKACLRQSWCKEGVCCSGPQKAPIHSLDSHSASKVTPKTSKLSNCLSLKFFLFYDTIKYLIKAKAAQRTMNGAFVSLVASRSSHPSE